MSSDKVIIPVTVTESKMNLYKIGMHFMNMMCIVLSLVTMLAGYGVMMRLREVGHILQGTPLHMPSAILYTVGLAMFILVVTIGCVGVMTENGTLLFMYSFFMLFLIIVQVGLACFAVLQVDYISSYIGRVFKEQFISSARGNETSIEYFSMVQTKLQCCGYSGVEDYGCKIPDSCCESPLACDLSNSYAIGCVAAMTSYVHNITEIFSGICVVSSLLQFFVVIYIGFFADKVKLDRQGFYD